MTVKKVDLGDAGKSFDRAESHLMRNAMNLADPLYNFSAAVQNYFGGLAITQVKIAEGLNDILERLERIENAIKGTSGQRRP